MQMNGSGIICTGYLLCNPPTQELYKEAYFYYGSSTSKSISYSPNVGYHAICKTTNTGSQRGWPTLVLSGTYVPLSGGGTTNSPSYSVGALDEGASYTWTSGWVRYA